MAKYENARAMPNADTLVRIARTLDVTTDYLLLDELSDESSEGHLDQELLVYFRAVTALEERDRNIVIALIDAFVRSRRHPPENDTTIG